MVDLWNQLDDLQSKFTMAQQTLGTMDKALAEQPAEALQDLVGDELQQAKRRHDLWQSDMRRQREVLHGIAVQRHALEQEAVPYLQYMEKTLQQDQEDIEFCNQLEQKIRQFQRVHPALVKARDERVAAEMKRKVEEEERERKRREEEAEEKFRQAALAKETEAKPGMVWNPTTREYQALNTDEAWRD
jgi:hypothetical protein